VCVRRMGRPGISAAALQGGRHLSATARVSFTETASVRAYHQPSLSAQMAPVEGVEHRRLLEAVHTRRAENGTSRTHSARPACIMYTRIDFSHRCAVSRHPPRPPKVLTRVIVIVDSDAGEQHVNLALSMSSCDVSSTPLRSTAPVRFEVLPLTARPSSPALHAPFFAHRRGRERAKRAGARGPRCSPTLPHCPRRAATTPPKAGHHSASQTKPLCPSLPTPRPVGAAKGGLLFFAVCLCFSATRSGRRRRARADYTHADFARACCRAPDPCLSLASSAPPPFASPVNLSRHGHVAWCRRL
jgi:hypothetical protein